MHKNTKFTNTNTHKYPMLKLKMQAERDIPCERETHEQQCEKETESETEMENEADREIERENESICVEDDSEIERQIARLRKW